MIRSEESILITGGSGSLGHAIVRELLKYKFPPKRIIIYSRDEYKQLKMAETFGQNSHLRFFIGDVRDKGRLLKALNDVQYVVHAAALKQVPVCEYNPEQAVGTNVIGAQNVIDACIDREVKLVVALSSDKAVNPINLYGATKLVSEKLFIAGNAVGKKRTRFSVVRYGNVLGSRGSVLQMFREQLLRGVPLTITDPRMTRFWWTVEQAAQFVLECRSRMIGGEVFLPKIYSSKMGDLAGVTSALLGIGEPKINVVGVRPGEKMHEVLMAPDEVSRTHDLGWCYAVYPSLKFFDMDNRVENLVDSYFVYSSSDTLMRDDVLEALVGRALGKEKP